MFDDGQNTKKFWLVGISPATQKSVHEENQWHDWKSIYNNF